MIRFACPSCGAVFTANDEKGGKTGTCSKCKAQFIIPDAPAPTAPPPPKAPPLIPVHVPPLTAPQPRQPAPVAKVIRSDSKAKRSVFDDDEDAPAPRRSKLTDDDDADDRPRRRSKLNDDDEDDRPRRRSENRRGDDDDEDRRRRRPRRDDDYDDDYDRRPRPKRQHPAILTAGILFLVFAILIGTLSIIDMTDLSGYRGLSSTSGMNRDIFTKEVQSMMSQIDTAMIFLQISVYGAIVAAVGFLVAGIGMLLQLVFGRISGLISSGLSIALILCIVIFIILILTAAPSGGSGTVTTSSTASSGQTKFIFRYLLRIAALAAPSIAAGVLLFRYDVIKKLR